MISSCPASALRSSRWSGSRLLLLLWLESPLPSVQSHRSVISQAFKHSLFTALAGSWRGSVTCCRLIRLNTQGSKSDSEWLSSEFSPYPGGGLQLGIEGFHLETLLSIFHKLSINPEPSLSGTQHRTGHGTLCLDDGSMILSDHCDRCLHGRRSP